MRGRDTIVEDLAPDIVRFRTLIEGYYTVDLDVDSVAEVAEGLAAACRLNPYAAPLVHAPESAASAGNQGFDVFLPLADSGIAIYTWSKQRFLSVVMVTCADFDPDAAVGYLKDRLGMERCVHRSF
jgi:S-adenosylmethionine/arginine decarboxylase-like enzyme